MSQLALRKVAPRRGAVMYVWHAKGDRYRVVRWLPGTHLTRANARLLALQSLSDDPRATKVQVVFDGDDFEEAVRSDRGICRLRTTVEKGEIRHESDLAN